MGRRGPLSSESGLLTGEDMPLTLFASPVAESRGIETNDAVGLSISDTDRPLVAGFVNKFSQGVHGMPVPGTMGKILIVDLSTQEISVETPSDDLYLKYLGGYGFGGLLPLQDAENRASTLWAPTITWGSSLAC